MSPKLLLSTFALVSALSWGCGGPDPETLEPEQGESPPASAPEDPVGVPVEAETPEEVLPGPPPAAKSMLIVFDGSGSMRARREERRKIDIARAAVQELIADLPDEAVSAGLIGYGHRRENDCGDIELIAPLAPLDRSALAASVASIGAVGKTPIAQALELAGEALAGGDDEKSIVLLTDGEDTCGGDASQVAGRLYRDLGLRVHVVGFDIVEPEAAIELRNVAEAGGGGYFTAATIEGLSDMTRRVAVAVETGEVRLNPSVQENIHIVLDRSSGMQDAYVEEGRETTRLALARAALVKVLGGLAADRDNLAYRPFGGSCEGEGSELEVPFGLNRGPEIRARLGHLQGRGGRALVDAVIEAAYDFDRYEIRGEVSRRVVIITGGTGECFRNEANAIIRQRLENRDIQPDYHFIAIGVTSQQIAELKSMAESLGGSLVAVLTQEEMEDELEWIFETLPASRSLDQVIDIVNGGVALLGEASDQLSRNEFAGAAETARRSGDLSATELPFRDLARRRAPQFVEFFEIARQLRDLQREMVPLFLSMVEDLEQGEIEAYNAKIDQDQELSRRYNELVAHANGVLSAL